MTKNVNITIDIKIARTMLGLAGFNPEKLKNATDDEIFAKVLSLIECYGAASEVKENGIKPKHQIDEMAGILIDNDKLCYEIVEAVNIATVLCNADYRKQSETAEEIFEEMGGRLTVVDGHPGLYAISEADFAEIRTKHVKK